MERDSRKEVSEEGFEWGADTIETEIRERVRGMIEAIVEEELESTLGAGRSERVGAVRSGHVTPRGRLLSLSRPLFNQPDQGEIWLFTIPAGCAISGSCCNLQDGDTHLI
jgi:hypothetical protein